VGGAVRTLRQLSDDRWRLRSYVLNHIVTRVPLIGMRMWLFEMLHVQMEDRERTTILLGTRMWMPENVSIGADSVIGRECRVEAGGGVSIGRSVNISSGVRLQTGSHDILGANFAARYRPIVIGDFCWICEAATIIGGVSIGDGAVVMAGAVVSQDVAPWSIVGGVPARPIGERPPATYANNWRPNFN
jgi:putative colanic acid biosynthesis acetyltransferase WcaF